jgi:hypothetical protein
MKEVLQILGRFFSPTYIAYWDLKHHRNIKEALLTLSLTNAVFPKLALFADFSLREARLYRKCFIGLGGGGGVVEQNDQNTNT